VKRREWSRRPLRIAKIGEDARLGQMHVGRAQIRPRFGASVPGTGMGGYTGLEESQALPAMRARACFATLQLWPHWTTARSSKVSKAADTCSTLGTAHLGAQGGVLDYTLPTPLPPTCVSPLACAAPPTNLIPLYTHPYHFHPTSRGPFSLCSLFRLTLTIVA
jgi:hypothetical protein